MTERTFYPLTSAQTLLYYNMKLGLKPAVVNICAMAHFEKDIDPKLMLEAMILGFEQNRSSSIRIVKIKEDGIRQYFSDEAPQGVEIVDFSAKSEKKFENYIKKLSQTSFPNGSMDTQLYKAKLIKKPDGMYALYYCVSHIIFDAYSLMQMADNVLTIYEALRDGKPVPDNRTDPIPAFEIDRKYQESPRKQKDIEFWAKEIFNTEPHYTSVSGMKHLIKGTRYGKTMAMLHPSAKHINYTIDKETVDAVNDFSVENNISPQSIYWLAVYRYMSKVCDDQQDVTFYSAIAKRWNKVLKHAGGTVAQAIPVRLNMPKTTTFIDACKQADRLKTSCYMHANLPILDINKIYRENFNIPIMKGYVSTNFTYQPYHIPYHESVPIHLTMHSTGANTVQLYLTIMSLDYSGCLNCNYDYNTYFVKPKDVQSMHEYLLWFLRTAVSNPMMTLEELTEMKKCF